MIRRPAALVGTGDLGYVLGWLVQVDVTGNQSMVMAFECTLPSAPTGNPGVVTLQPAINIRFLDGSPPAVPTIE